jgi:hypothetical protein
MEIQQSENLKTGFIFQVKYLFSEGGAGDHIQVNLRTGGRSYIYNVTSLCN